MKVPIVPATISRHTVDAAIDVLEVSFVKLVECLVASGWRLELAGTDAPSIHYNIAGRGTLITSRSAPIDLRPHTLVILPRHTAFALETPGALPMRTVNRGPLSSAPGSVRRFTAGPSAAHLVLVCGYFRALYGTSIDVFDTLRVPIVEYFDEIDQIDHKFREAVDELAAQEVGTGAMAAGLLKLVLIAIFRRSLVSQQVWAERFSLLSDPQISRAFSEMAARPAADHTVSSLAHVAGLSRSAFLARFTKAFGTSPMSTLRQLRIRHAAALLATNVLPIDQIAQAVGYRNRSSFSRAFKKTYLIDPSEYRNRKAIQEGEVYNPDP